MTAPVHQAVLPLLLIPMLLALGMALAPRFTLRWLGWLIVLNLLLAAGLIATQTPRKPEPVHTQKLSLRAVSAV